ncbi:DUF1905 domain-containing protein [Ruania zhangjianzhongii]|uniref:DUF1905 domain-containing protein n=1 Tax=Ruania zhangjianzhongii TaxID=2603206 RepID=UPI0011CB98E6|nr:DUF1905 domain-containing protein [Ruania zhangjianzhongii]
MTLTMRTTLAARGPAAAIVLTDDQVAELGTAKTAPVTVTIAGRTARLRLARMGGENLIGMSKAARAQLGVQTGDEVEAAIAPDQAERTVDLPGELSDALTGAGLTEAFAGWSYSRRKESARSVAEAKAAETKARRVAKVLDQLGG